LSSLNIKLHKAQYEIFNSPAKVKVVCCGRGFGKTRLLRASALRSIFTFNGVYDPESPQEAVIVAPTLKKAVELHWLPLVTMLENTPIVRKIDHTKKIIYFRNNLPLLSLAGVDDGGEKIRGKNLIYAGLEEFQAFPSHTWDEIITPSFRDPSGYYQADVVGTPKGKNSHFYQFHLRALTNRDWKYFHFISEDNPFHPKELREQAKLTLPPKVYLQEYCASWEEFSGVLYDQFDHSINVVDELPEQFESIFIGLDHGETNPAASVIGLYQGKYFIIDVWYNPHPGLPITQDEVNNAIANLCIKYNVYRTYSPDDRPSVVVSLRRLGDLRGISGLKRAVTSPRNKPGVMEGISIINSLFYQKRLFVHRRLEKLITNISSYHKAEDRNGLILEEPAKNQEDHDLDSFRYVIPPLEIKYNLMAA
jgi:hypothetical protein